MPAAKKNEDLDTYVAEEIDELEIDESTLEYLGLASAGDKAMVTVTVPVPNPKNGTITWIKVARVLDALPDETAASLEQRTVFQTLNLLESAQANLTTSLDTDN